MADGQQGAGHRHDALRMSAVARDGRPKTGGRARAAARPGSASAVRISATLAASPSRQPRNAHGIGSGAGPVPLNCLASPWPARPPRAIESPASISPRSAPVSQSPGLVSGTLDSGPDATDALPAARHWPVSSQHLTGTTVAPALRPECRTTTHLARRSERLAAGAQVTAGTLAP